MVPAQIVRSLYETLNTHNLQKFVSMFTDDGQFVDKSSGTIYRGREEIREMMANWLKAFPDVRIQVSNIIGSGDLYCAEFSIVGTHRGPLTVAEGEVPATGKKINVPSCDVIQLKKERIQSLNCYMSATVLMDQIGELPSQAQVGRPEQEMNQQNMM